MCYNVKSLLTTQLKRAIQKNDADATFEIKEKLARYGVEDYHKTSGFEHRAFVFEDANGFKISNWGLIPDWVQNIEQANEIQNKTINARIETLRSKPSFREAFKQGRGIITVDGFYDFENKGKIKTPHFLHQQNKALHLACISTEWIDQNTGEIKDTFSIVTKRGSGIIEKIHVDKEPRLPCIIEGHQIENWISKGKVDDLSSNEMNLTAHQVRPLTGKNSVGNEAKASEKYISNLDKQTRLF